MSTYIYASSAISTQNNLIGETVFDSLVSIEKNKDLIEPNYGEYIKPMVIRRMSKATKMAVTCAFSCLKVVGNEPLDAIIIGTGLGAITDTEKFLNVSISSKDKMLSPTAFIQSGHNSIAGQIALLIKNDCYNMTHVQQGLSFEHALLDAILNLSEGKKNVLVGGVDEKTPLLGALATRFQLDADIQNQLSEGSAFFVMGPKKNKAITRIKAVCIMSFTNADKAIESFLKNNGLSFDDVQKGFLGNNMSTNKLSQLPIDTLVYTDYSGRHFSSSAYGVYLASEYLGYNKSTKFALVINVAANNKLGLTLIESV